MKNVKVIQKIVQLIVPGAILGQSRKRIIKTIINQRTTGRKTEAGGPVGRPVGRLVDQPEPVHQQAPTSPPEQETPEIPKIVATRAKVRKTANPLPLITLVDREVDIEQ